MTSDLGKTNCTWFEGTILRWDRATFSTATFSEPDGYQLGPVSISDFEGGKKIKHSADNLMAFLNFKIIMRK